MGLRVMVIEAHVDDACCGCAGTIYKHIKRGDQVQWHTMIGKGYRVPEQWAPQSLRIEYKNAMQQLGVKDSRLYGFSVDTADMMPEIRDLMYKRWHTFDPDIAYVPWKGSRHQDHRAVGDFASQISWRTNADVFAFPVVNDIAGFTPNVFSPIDDDAFIVKMDTLAEFKSQFVLRPWFSLDLVASYMASYAPFVIGSEEDYVEPFEQVKRVIA